MLTLVLGASGSGKSARLLESLRLRAENGQKSILLVPEQFTSSTEGTLYATLGDTLSARVESYSFTSLAEAILRRYGGAAVPTMTEAGRAVLVRRALDSLMDKVVYYSRQRRSAAFCEKAAQTIEELKSAGVMPETLAAYARAPGADTGKLSELALIYGAYEALLAQTAMDPGDRQQLAADRLEPEFFAGRAVYLDEFDTFNAPKRALVRAMLPVTDVTVALCWEEGGLFAGAQQVVSMLRRMAAEAGVVCHTEILREDHRHLAPALQELNRLLIDPEYTPESASQGITWYTAPTRQGEAKAVAAMVAAAARAGTPYRRMAVICRKADTYLSALRYEFRLQNIPLFCDEATTPEHTAPARAVQAAFDLLRGGINTRTMLRLLKTGLVFLPPEQQAALENYAYTWPLKAGEWRQKFTKSAAGYADRVSEEDELHLRQAEAARAFLVGAAERLLERGKRQPVREVYFFLQAVGAEKSVEALAEELRAQGDFPAADEAVREWNTVMALLSDLVRLLEEGDAAEYAELFTLLLRTTDMGHIPQSLDSVILTTAGRMRLPEIDACFVLGLNEGEFPETPGDSGLLTHADRDAMIAQGAQLPDCFENRALREGICFYKALTTARKTLWLSAAEPSTAILPILEKLDVPTVSLDCLELAATPAAALDQLGELWRQEGAGTKRASLEASLRGQPGLEAVRRAADGTKTALREPGALESLLGDRIRISPTRFEKYITCPFGYYLEYIAGAKPRKKAELAPNISGTLTHWVLEQVLKRYTDTFQDWDNARIEAEVTALVKEYAEANLPGESVRMEYLLQRIARNLVGLLGFIGEDLRQSGFHPAAFELRIDDHPGCVPPVELPDGLGHTVRVVGTIDRVDTMPGPGGKTWVRVVDYKTGSKKFDLREVYCGLDCQMLLYLFTLERSGGALFPNPAAAGVEYLLADPAPKTEDRPDGGEEPVTYPVEGLLLDEERVYRAMDQRGTGRFVPLRFSEKTGMVNAASRRHLAGEAKLARIRDHLDGMVTGMARDLYNGRIPASPLCAGRTPCDYCDYRLACPRADGDAERTEIPQSDPFE